MAGADTGGGDGAAGHGARGRPGINPEPVAEAAPETAPEISLASGARGGADTDTGFQAASMAVPDIAADAAPDAAEAGGGSGEGHGAAGGGGAAACAPAGPDPEAQAVLRWLRRLVTALAVVMGLGILAVAAVLWVRLGPGSQPAPAALPVLPAQIALPQGARAEAVTFARDWLIVVTDSGEVLLFDRDGALRQRIAAPQSP